MAINYRNKDELAYLNLSDNGNYMSVFLKREHADSFEKFLRHLDLPVTRENNVVDTDSLFTLDDYGLAEQFDQAFGDWIEFHTELQGQRREFAALQRRLARETSEDKKRVLRKHIRLRSQELKGRVRLSDVLSSDEIRELDDSRTADEASEE